MLDAHALGFMRRLWVAALVLFAAGCGSALPAEPYVPGVRVELALVDGELRPPVFRWDAPVASRVTVRRGGAVMWDVAEGDVAGPNGGVRRGPITPPLTYGASFGGVSPAPRVLVPPASLMPRTVYEVTVVGTDGAVVEGRFSVNGPISF